MKTSLLILLPLLLAAILLTSCDDKIEVQQAYNFSLSTMPVQKRIKQGETAEVRCRLHKSGHYAEAKFYISMFQFDGRGSLRMDDGTLFLPNDFYPLDRETFRLYYTSECTDQQQLTVFIHNEWGQTYELSLSFQNENEKEEAVN